jgi:hypothetical protein
MFSRPSFAISLERSQPRSGFDQRDISFPAYSKHLSGDAYTVAKDDGNTLAVTHQLGVGQKKSIV